MKKRSRAPTDSDFCSIRAVLDGIGGKWGFLILLALANGPMRFGEFRVEIDRISQRALAETLRDLRRDGLVARDVFSTTPPSVRYRLTDLGKSLVVPIRELERWATESVVAIVRHREAFDATECVD
jgi:DNA-binding HxlR family transcriptional regulator